MWYFRVVFVCLYSQYGYYSLPYATTRLLIGRFPLFFSSSPNSGQDIGWHRRAFFDLVSWSKRNATVLDISIKQTKLFLATAWNGVHWFTAATCWGFLELACLSCFEPRCFNGESFFHEAEDELVPRRSTIFIIGLFPCRLVEICCLRWS